MSGSVSVTSPGGSGNLVNLLNKTITNYSDVDPAWRQFVDDHKAFLIANSTTMQISESYMQQFVQDLPRYLRSINYNTQVTWIIWLINDLVTDIAFVQNIGTLLIPPFQIIENLYTSFITATSNV
jgi:hypothetical protein